MQNTLKPARSGSVVPDLEGAPASVCHPARQDPVTPPPAPQAGLREGDAPSKP